MRAKSTLGGGYALTTLCPELCPFRAGPEQEYAVTNTYFSSWIRKQLVYSLV
jgi:hypothetical protein